MKKDMCVVVDENDNIVGHGSKRDCHIFNDQQSGKLHRAFSVFLFDDHNRLLLQKRSPEKITFPEMWTNTCCSHPLYGFDPPEVDTDDAIRTGTVQGVKRAAIRKLGHELGIDASQLDLTDFKYLTRLHYCASDVKGKDQDWAWGEHEMDYILFIRKHVHLSINPEEICDHRYVDLAELQSMMSMDSGLKWSPWFRIIAKRWLETWWNDLEGVLNSDAHVDLETIHRLSLE